MYDDVEGVTPTDVGVRDVDPGGILEKCSLTDLYRAGRELPWHLHFRRRIKAARKVLLNTV